MDDDERMPAECFPVSDFIREELTARGWTEDDLAMMVGWSRDTLDALLVRDEPITREQAADIARGFDTSQTFWLHLETQYRRWLSRYHVWPAR